MMTSDKNQPPLSSTGALPTLHKRQASIGLGIVTKLTPESDDITNFIKEHRQKRRESFSKNDTFFDTAIYSQMKPPPSLIKSINKTNHCHGLNSAHYYHCHHHAAMPNSSTTPPPSFADRIRNIVLANRKIAAAVCTPLSNVLPIPEPNIVIHDTMTEYEDMLLPFPEEKIIPLPSPAPPMYQAKVDEVPPPPSPPPSSSSAIPVISLSPNFSPNKTNVIPSLQDVPMLGDDDDDDSVITHEYTMFPSPTLVMDDQLIGKHIWKFRIKQLLGVGAFSRVFLAENLEEGGKFAVKMINKKRMLEDARVKSSIEREIGVLKFLDHERIVQLEATMETEQHLCIVLEYVQGGELFDFVQHMHTDIHKVGIQSNIDEILIKRLAMELIQVVSWLHEHNIVHRDLKLENILVYFDDATGDVPHIKVTDFGLARVVNPEEPTLTTRCGSEEYAAPEIVQSLGYDGRLTDTWSIGIIIYALLVGYLPFSYDPNKGEKTSHLFHRIVMAQVKWPINDNISNEAKDVVNQILVRQPEKRIRLHQVEKLPWFGLL